jgi:methylated-DNA-[protein]-cysteine S-methyltransferase
MTNLLIDKVASPIGTLLIVSADEQLYALDYADYEQRMLKLLHARYRQVRLQEAANPSGLSDALRAYLAGEVGCLDRLPVNPGGTPFQQGVWEALRTIPPGSVMTYGELATRLGKPSAARAVGAANALNPIAIVIPCHRLVGANSALTGYAGGLERKRWLLEHEGVDMNNVKREALTYACQFKSQGWL